MVPALKHCVLTASVIALWLAGSAQAQTPSQPPQASPGAAPQAAAAAGRPNILVIWGDDIGTWNISHNNRGMMGYQTPNIDRIADGVFPSPTTTPSRAARLGAPPSSAATCLCAPA